MALFRGGTDEVPYQGVTCLPVNQVELAIPNPTLSVSDDWTSSYDFTGHLVASLQGRTLFKTRDKTLILMEGRGDIRCHNMKNSQAALEEAMEDAPALESYQLRRVTNMGA